MLKRILSGAVGITFIISVMILSGTVPVIVDTFVAAVCAVAVGEFANAAKLWKHWQIVFPSMAFAVVYPMLMTYGMMLILGYIYTAIMLAAMIFCHEKISFKEFACLYSMTVIITVSLSTIIQMKDMDTAHSSFYFAVTLALPWLADAGAYFAGSFFGKHKLCPSISPKKTIEGAIGGTLVCVLATCGIGWLFAEVIFGGRVRMNYINLAVLSFIGSLLSILGDLSFSVIKRTFAIKDYGNLIPGHGGILDRFDSVVVVSPFLYIMMAYMPIMGV